MKNFWLDQLRIGRCVKYNGPDIAIQGLIGMVTNILNSWVNVTFIKKGNSITVTVEKEYLEIIRN
jgi:hypothetical protein